MMVLTGQVAGSTGIAVDLGDPDGRKRRLSANAGKIGFIAWRSSDGR